MHSHLALETKGKQKYKIDLSAVTHRFTAHGSTVLSPSLNGLPKSYARP
jgi:hypothetical protein